MEHVYSRVPDPDTRELYLREQGSGRIAYVPWDIDRTFWEIMNADHGRLLGNIIRWALNEEPVVQVTGRGVLDITAWRQKQSLTVHLVNLTNPMMLKGPFRELIPVDAQEVRIRVGPDMKVQKAHLLVSDKTPEYKIADGVVTLVVPSVLDHEVIALDSML
jgi:hypothetical protein